MQPKTIDAALMRLIKAGLAAETVQGKIVLTEKAKQQMNRIDKERQSFLPR
jgi:hypothetical protein